MRRKYRMLACIVLVLLFCTPVVSAQDTSASCQFADSKLIELQRFGQGVPRDIALSPDAQTLAVANGTGIYLHDAETLTLTNLFQPVSSYLLAWSPDGKYLAAYAEGVGIRIWNVQNKQLVSVLAGGDESRNYALTLVWSPDASHIAVVHASSLRVWDISKQRVVLEYKIDFFLSSVMPNLVAWSPDGTYLALGDKGAVRIWDAVSWRQFRTLPSRSFIVAALAWSTNKQLAALGQSGEEEIIVWDTTTWQSVLTINGGNLAASIVWSPDNKALAIVRNDAILIVNPINGAFLRQIKLEDRIYRLTWLPDAKRLIGIDAGGTIRVWDVTTGRELANLMSPWTIRNAAWSPDGKRVALSYGIGDIGENTITKRYGIQVWDTANSQLLINAQTDANGRLSNLSWSPDGKRIAASANETIYLWNADNNWSLTKLERLYGEVRQIAWSPDSKQLVSTSDSNLSILTTQSPLLGSDVRLWDAASGKSIKRLSNAYTQALVIPTANGWYAALRPEDGTVRLEDLSSGKVLQNFPKGLLADAVWTPTTHRLTIVSADNENLLVQIFNMDTGQETFKLNGPYETVRLLPQGHVLQVGTFEALEFWDIDSGKLRFKIPNWLKLQPHITYSPDETCIALASLDGDLTIFDSLSGQKITLPGKRINGAAWSFDSALLATTGNDGTLRIWGKKP